MKRKAKVLKWTRENTLKDKVPNKPGYYKFYDKDGNFLYVGHSRCLRHRIQSYRQKDCFVEHHEKRPLRPKIAKFSYKVLPKAKAQEFERKIKKQAKYNKL